MKGVTEKARAMPQVLLRCRSAKLKRLIPALQSELDAIRREERRRKKLANQGAR